MKAKIICLFCRQEIKGSDHVCLSEEAEPLEIEKGQLLVVPRLNTMIAPPEPSLQTEIPIFDLATNEMSIKKEKKWYKQPDL